ncbi:MAG: hypothetical protein GTO13_10320 [Proteobacteria bacterium]|nr:hypothetical protein [Pseudomonadota bacterium]
MGLFAEPGFERYHFDFQMDAGEVVKKVGNRMPLVGCVNNPQVLYQGTPEDAYPLCNRGRGQYYRDLEFPEFFRGLCCF